MFYIIEREYVGPNRDQHADDGHIIIVQNVPGRTNSSYEERIDGWLGTTNDWAEYARGEYGSLESARAAVIERFGPCRAKVPVFEDDNTCVECYRVGEFAQMSREETSDWIYPGLQSCVAAETTDSELDALISEWESDANSQGYTFDSRATDMARAYRDEQIENRNSDE